MTVVILAQRHLRLFFRDRMAVLFSVLAALILFALYKLFLGGLQIGDLQEAFPEARRQDLTWFIDAWMFAGVITMTTVTTGLSAMEIFVNDRANGRFRDFTVSPLSRAQLIFGYLISSVILSVLMSVLVLAAALMLLTLTGTPALPPDDIGRVLTRTVLLCLVFSAMSAFVATFIQSTSAFTSLATVTGTLLGFVAAAYVPIGVLPTTVADILSVLPFAPAAMLLREPMTRQSVATITGGQPEAAAVLEETYGITLAVGATDITTVAAILGLATIGTAFALLGAARLGKTLN